MPVPVYMTECAGSRGGYSHIKPHSRYSLSDACLTISSREFQAARRKACSQPPLSVTIFLEPLCERRGNSMRGSVKSPIPDDACAISKTRSPPLAIHEARSHTRAARRIHDISSLDINIQHVSQHTLDSRPRSRTRALLWPKRQVPRTRPLLCPGLAWSEGIASRDRR
jgi:hypothetical protein